MILGCTHIDTGDVFCLGCSPLAKDPLGDKDNSDYTELHDGDPEVFTWLCANCGEEIGASMGKVWAHTLAKLMTPEQFSEFALYMDGCTGYALSEALCEIDAKRNPELYKGGSSERRSWWKLQILKRGVWRDTTRIPSTWLVLINFVHLREAMRRKRLKLDGIRVLASDGSVAGEFMWYEV